MGIFSIANQHIRFAVKLATAIVLALFVGFHFQLETPRWAVLTAAIVAAGPAFAAGGEPYSGAIRYRGFLRIIGTFIGCIAGLVIIIAMIRAPLLMILVCCIWAGFCTWISSLVRIENSYAWGLAGYTALIIVITIQPEPLLTPQFAVERCSEIVIGIVCAIMADLLFSPRSIKQEVDRELESLLVAQYQLMQLMFIIRRSNCQIRYRSQISHIKSPMMRRSVFTHQSGLATSIISTPFTSVSVYTGNMARLSASRDT